MENELTHGSLFSGIGGFELGARWSGIQTKWNCEILDYNREILKYHFPKTYQYSDILKMENPAYVDIISGGFPCQDISIANQSSKNEKGIKGKRSGLWSEMFRVIREVRPKYVVIENSPAITVRGLEQVLCNLSEIGYNAEWQSISARAFGYNHKRERFYCVAYSTGIGCLCSNEVFRRYDSVHSKRNPSKQMFVPMPAERFDSGSDFSRVQLHDGFSGELDKAAIAAFGNAVVPDIPHYIFECIKLHHEQVVNFPF